MDYVTREQLRLIYVGRDIELRIISLLVRASELASEVVLIDLGSNDRTVELADEYGCEVLHYNKGEVTAPELAKLIVDSKGSDDYSNLVIYIDDDWKLRELPVVVNRYTEGWDIYIAFNNSESTTELIVEELVICSLDIDHMVLSRRGLEELSKANSMTSTHNFSDQLRHRDWGCPHQGHWRVLLDTDSVDYGGYGSAGATVFETFPHRRDNQDQGLAFAVARWSVRVLALSS